MPATNHAAIAAETGYPVHEVMSRGAGYCRRNPRPPRQDLAFDQSLPADLDDIFVQENATEADQRLVARDHAAEAAIADYDADAVIKRLGAATAAIVKGGTAVAIYVSRMPVDNENDLTRLVGRVGNINAVLSPPLTIDRAASLEAAFRAATFAYAASRHSSAPGATGTNVDVDIRIGRRPYGEGIRLVGQHLGRTVLVSPELTVEDADSIEPAFVNGMIAYATEVAARAA